MSHESSYDHPYSRNPFGPGSYHDDEPTAPLPHLPSYPTQPSADMHVQDGSNGFGPNDQMSQQNVDEDGRREIAHPLWRQQPNR